MMMKVMMRKAQECAEQILGRDSPTPSTCKQLLPGNVLTPHNIPEFFLPPQLIRQHSDGPPMQTETGSPVRTQAHAQERGDIKGTALAAGGTKRWKERQPSQTQVLRRPAQLAVKPLDQGCLYESPHTRRKESLFHCTVSCLRLEPHSPAAALTHSHTRGAPGRAHTHASVARSSQASPLSHSALGESDAEVDTPSSTESTPQATPPTRRWSPSPSHLAPPLPFALELLHCQERLHREHLLLMPTRGRLRLATERPVPSPSYDQPPILRVRVVSVEGLRDAGELRPFSCGLSLCLTPGKLQQQHSATIRHCREPVVFNEDFYFSQPEGQALSRMELQIKVKDKSGGLGRVCVLGVISKPLSELMAL
ncbi:C2 calcium-dependent domain-containing protein 4C [Clupea harengus]|uniref:C2 calcium-dependent domain-containing protein 4C n=1 Tax=Clupea harengus TaxID=7950 RepID=A0A6P3VN23_CLUHA|nr:C2 calcium-dependent domain-containing protein 4C [Clupea harengus]